MLHLNKNKKKKQCNEHVLQVEYGSFTPLVMSSNGEFGRECGRFYSKLAEQIAEKQKQPYSIISSWIKRKEYSLVTIYWSMFKRVEINKGKQKPCKVDRKRCSC